jgi:hypothetical protein
MNLQQRQTPEVPAELQKLIEGEKGAGA